MDIEEQTQFVLKEMRRYRKVDDIIYELCDRTGGKWPETSAFVHQVIADNPDKIEQGREPLIIVICVGLTIAGLAGVIGSLAVTLGGVMISIRHIPFAGNIAIFLTGLAALAGGVRGLYDLFYKTAPDSEI